MLLNDGRAKAGQRTIVRNALIIKDQCSPDFTPSLLRGLLHDSGVRTPCNNDSTKSMARQSTSLSCGDAQPQPDARAPARNSVMHESEYAGGEWTIEGFVASLPVPSAIAVALRHKSCVPAGGEFDFVRSFTSEAAIIERLREGQLIESVAKEVWAGTQKLQTATAASGAELNAKFAADGEAFKGEMGFGGTEEFYAGVLQPPPRDAEFAGPCT